MKFNSPFYSFLAAWLGATGLARAAAGQGFKLPHTELALRPFAEAGVTWDSNAGLSGDINEDAGKKPVETDKAVDLNDDEESDTFLFGRVGLDAGMRQESLGLDFNGWIGGRRYMEYTELDTTEGGESMALRLGTRDRLEVQAIQSFSITEQYGYSPVRSDDPQMRMQPAASSAIDREELTRRAEWQAGLMAGRQLSRKVDGDLSYNFTATEYEDDALLSYQTHEAQLDLGWNVTAKSDVLLVASAGMQDSDGYTEPANTAALRIGAGSRHDVKLRYRAAAGVGYMSYSDEIPDSESTALATAARTSEADEGGNSDELRPSFELGLDWTPVRRFSANVSANSGFQPSGQYAANAMYSTAIRAGLSYRFARNWMLKLYGGYRHDDYLEPVDRVVETNISTPTVKFERYDKQTGLWNVGTRMVYEPESARWLNVYVSLSSDTMTSNDDNAEYDAVRATLGATARY